MTKTLLLSEVFPPLAGGSGRWLWEVYRRLPGEGVVVAAGQHSQAAEFDSTHDVRIRRMPLAMRSWGLASRAGIAGYWRAAAILNKIIRRDGITQIHCGKCLPEGALAWLLQRRFGLPYLCYIHGEELHVAHGSRELAWMTRRVLSGADYLIANSQNTRSILRSGWNVPDEKIRVLHPGVDTSRFTPAEKHEAFRREIGWGERPVVLTVGRLQRRKGHDMAIRAMETIRPSVPEVLYAICGAGDERERLEGIVRERGLERHVQFLGEVDDERMIRCYQQCNVFVLANRQEGRDIEGFGMVLLEAQACGKPVIAGDSGGTAETMQIGETGFIVDCTSPEPLAALLGELLLDPTRCRVMGTRGREWVTSRFDWDALARQAWRLFQGEAPLPRIEPNCEEVASVS